MKKKTATTTDASTTHYDVPVEPLAVMHLAGPQAAQGAQHGALSAAAGGFEPLLDFYPRMPARMIGGALGGHALANRLEALSRPILDAVLGGLESLRPPELLARSQAYLRALGRPAEHARHLFVMDVFQNAVNAGTGLDPLFAGLDGLARVTRRLGSVAPTACSSLVGWGPTTADGRLLHARNFDFPGVGVWDPRPSVVFCRPTDAQMARGELRYGFVTTRSADVPGVTCFNEAGLTLAAHTRFHRDARLRGAGIVDLGHRIIRRARTLADAVRIAREVPIASTWGLAIGSASEGRAVILEITGKAVRVVDARPGEAFAAQTNHYADPGLSRGERTVAPAFRPHSEGRLAVLRRHGLRGGLTERDLARMLASWEDPTDPTARRAAGGVLAQALTVQSVVIDPERQAVHVGAAGPPVGHGSWVTVPWTWPNAPTLSWVATPESDRAQAATDGAPAGLPGAEVWGAEAEAPPAGWASYVEAVRGDTLAEPEAAVRRSLQAAVAEAPGCADYRLAAGVHALRDGDLDEAAEHLDAGVASEDRPFYRGQLAFWAARAHTARGDRTRAAGHRQTLEAEDHPSLAKHRKAAARDAVERPSDAELRRAHVALGMLDASP